MQIMPMQIGLPSGLTGDALWRIVASNAVLIAANRGLQAKPPKQAPDTTYLKVKGQGQHCTLVPVQGVSACAILALFATDGRAALLSDPASYDRIACLVYLDGKWVAIQRIAVELDTPKTPVWRRGAASPLLPREALAFGAVQRAGLFRRPDLP